MMDPDQNPTSVEQPAPATPVRKKATRRKTTTTTRKTAVRRPRKKVADAETTPPADQPAPDPAPDAVAPPESPIAEPAVVAPVFSAPEPAPPPARTNVTVVVRSIPGSYQPRQKTPEEIAADEARLAALTAEAQAQARLQSRVEVGQRRPDAPPQPPEPAGEPMFAEGLVEVSGKGFGFLRSPERNFAQSPSDIFVTPDLVRNYGLRDGQWLKGEVRRGSRGLQLFRLTAIEGEDPEKMRELPAFDELTVLNPTERIRFETVPDRFTTRVIDLMTPVGKGQRGLIVAAPRTGKTTILEHMADGVAKNHPEIKVIMLLVDERPEEVTEIRRTCAHAEIMASSNDSDVKSHTRIAQLAVERAKRLVEAGRDVFILMDSLTRVGRAFNNATAGTGRTLSGGMDARAMEIPRRLFAAARNTEEAGTLTIVATALIETGSRMDELIFQEFKGTGNMEIVLSRQIADLRTYPAIDIFLSGTRREELLLPESDLHKISMIRRGLSGHKPYEAIERLLSFMRKFPTNAQLLREIPG